MEDGLIDNNKAITNDNKIKTGGGGVYLSHGGDRNGVFTMNGGTISENEAYDNGGGIYAANGTSTKNSSVTINSGVITGNQTTNFNGGGGGVALGTYAELLLENDSTINKNVSRGSGGGVYGITSVFTMVEGSITGNKAPSYGGGVFMGTGSSFSMSDGKIDNNTLTSSSSGFGGGVSLSSGSSFTMSGGKIENNTITANSNSNGGGVYLYEASGTMTGGSITGNEAKNYGGGVCVYYGSDFTLKGKGIIESNYAGSGGGVEVDGNTTFAMSGGTIKGNTAGDNGGGIMLKKINSTTQINTATFIMTGGTISGNTALGNSGVSGNGGGVNANEGSVFTMDGGSITGNKTQRNGGGVYANASNLNLYKGTIEANEAAIGTGGGIYTSSYSNLSISSNVDFGRVDTPSANIASESSDWYTTKPIFATAFQTRFASPVGIYTDWGPQYSTSANHPVNGFDINVILRSVNVYYRDDTLVKPLSPIGSLSSTLYTVGEGTPFKLEDIPLIGSHTLKGWAEGSVTSELKTPPVYIDSVTASKNIYLIYQPITWLTVSNEVEGSYALINKLFEYTVYLADSHGTLLQGTKEFQTSLETKGKNPTYTSGTLLFTDGTATFQLKHDQVLEIYNLPLEYKFRIVQTTAVGYVTSYIDHKNNINPNPDPEVESNDTSPTNTNNDMRQMSKYRRISFRNKMQTVNETGLSSNNANLFGLSMLAGTAGLAFALQAFLIKKLKRRLLWRRMIGCQDEEKETL